MDLYQRYVRGELEANSAQEAKPAQGEPKDKTTPEWFGILRRAKRTGRQAAGQDMESIRASIGAGIAHERDL